MHPEANDGGVSGDRGGVLMAKSGSEETNGELALLGDREEDQSVDGAHPYAFHVSGPRNLSSPTWRELLSSSWKDPNYRRTVVACFIQAVYLLEIDRQEGRTGDSALAPEWWTPFKYKLSQTLTDGRDGSIFGAILEWDRTAALADLILIRPSGAPRAVLALRGTLLKSPTIRRDVEDDLRFLALESLKGSVRFTGSLEALRSMANKYGSSNVCVAGHSLGAGFALQVGKTLAKQGMLVETHLFNPPSFSIAMSLRTLGEKAGVAWRKLKSMLPNQGAATAGDVDARICLKKWIPHLYVNNSDYICCYYTDPAGGEDEGKTEVAPRSAQMGAKLFVMSKGKQRFMEAHGLEQWWSDDVGRQLTVGDSKLITRQLKSVHTLPAMVKPPTKIK